jgi:hypothetical protein
MNVNAFPINPNDRIKHGTYKSKIVIKVSINAFQSSFVGNAVALVVEEIRDAMLDWALPPEFTTTVNFEFFSNILYRGLTRPYFQ